MLALDLTLYRFVCDLATFTGLFSTDPDGRRIPDTAAFLCCWSRVPRARQSMMNPVRLKQHGASAASFFKSFGSDMALTFAGTHAEVALDSDTTVLTFQVRPTAFEGGDIPVIAKGTLDPLPYAGKPKKNYAIKLRDASGQVIGKLLFALEVVVLPPGDRRAAAVAAASVESSREPSRVPPRGSGPRVESRSSSSSSSAFQSSSSNGAGESAGRPAGRPIPSPLRQREQEQQREAVRRSTEGFDAEAARAQRSPRRTEAAEASTTAPSLAARSPRAPKMLPITVHHSPSRSAERSVRAAPPNPTDASSLVLLIQRVSVKPEAIDLDHPAPLLLEGEYYLRVCYGPQTYYTPPVICTSPREVAFHSYRIDLTLPSGAPEKLRFSVWENRKQVAGFALDAAKLRGGSERPKEYTIPFRYHPTQQSACLDVDVWRTGPAGSGRHSPTATRDPQRVAPPSATRPLPRNVAEGSSGAGGKSRSRSPKGHGHTVSDSLGGAPAPASLITTSTPPRPLWAAPAPQAVVVPPSTASSRHVPPSHDREEGPAPARRRSTSSPPPRPTPLPLTGTRSRDTDKGHRPSQEKRRPMPPVTPLDAALGGVGTSPVGPPVPRLVARREDSSPRPLGLPPSPSRATSRDRGTPVRSCLPHTIADSSGTATRELAGKASALAEYIARVEQAKSRRPGVASPAARPESAGVRGADRLAESPRSRRSPPSERGKADGVAVSPRSAGSHHPHHHHRRREGSGSRGHRHPSTRRRDPAISDEMAAPHADTAAGSLTVGELSEHERYLAQVMARLGRQARAPPQRTALMEEWLGWREATSERNSRCNSVISGHHQRSPSMLSRDESVASVASRRATPLPTKSFADFAMQKPYQPEYSWPRRTASVSSVRQRPPLV